MSFAPEDEKELAEANALMVAYKLEQEPYVNAPIVWDAQRDLRRAQSGEPHQLLVKFMPSKVRS